MDIREFISQPVSSGTERHREQTEQVDIRRLFAAAGIEGENVNPEIFARLELLQRNSGFLEDEQHAFNLAQALFAYYEREVPDRMFSVEEQHEVLAGTLLSDIGKTGPKNATLGQQEVILDIFRIENVENPQITVRKLLEQHYAGDADRRIAALQQLGIDASRMPMRDFWNMHAVWTLGIIQNGGIPQEDVPAAAFHQILERVNEQYVGAGGRYVNGFGKNLVFDRPEKLVILLDKYDAFRSRLGKSHQEAIVLTRNLIERTPYANDWEFLELLTDMGHALA